MKAVEDAVAELNAIVSKQSIARVVGWCLAHNISTNAENDPRRDLSSPARQISFLLALTLGTPEPPEEPAPIEPNWDRVIELLNEAFYSYSLLFYPTDADFEDLGEEWKRARDVAMPAFLHYFNTGLLASVEQVRTRIQLYVAPFDGEIAATLGITASDALRIADWLLTALQGAMDLAQESTAAERKVRLGLLEAAQQAGWTKKQLQESTAASTYPEVAKEWMDRVAAIGVVRKSDLEAKFGTIGTAFWDRYSVGRGDGPAMKYPTEPSIVDGRPLVRVSENHAVCVSANALFTSVLTEGERILRASPVRESYFTRRGRELEKQAFAQMRRLLGPGAAIVQEVSATKDGQNEHDIVAIVGRTCLVIEAKASPPNEPLRDPDRAFVRLRSDFRASSGIQGGYEQGLRIWRAHAAGTTTVLYDMRGVQALVIDPSQVDQVICICVTRDDYGPLGVNLALLLERTPPEPLPWVVNILDLEAIADAWEHLKFQPSEFITFLVERERLHGWTFATDELEVVGYYLRHVGFASIPTGDNQLFFFGPEYSDFFEELYRHQHFDGPAPEVNVQKPIFTDLRKSLLAGRHVSMDEPPPESGIQGGGSGRNKPCPCGSGKKFKKCHGRAIS